MLLNAEMQAAGKTVKNLLAMGLRYDAVKAVLETMQARRKAIS